MVATLLLAACGEPVETVDFSDQVWFQRRQVTTDLISVPRKIGLDSASFGWRVVPDTGSGGHLETVAEPARLAFFSADGDAAAIDLEVRRPGASATDKIRLRARVNGETVARLPLEGSWRWQRIELPTGTVRRGSNLLDLELRGEDSKALATQTFDLREVQIRSSSGREPWPERPASIEASVADRERDSDRILMPSASWVEAFVELSDRATLEASFAVRKQAGEQDESVEVYGTLFDGDGETELFRRELAGGSGSERSGELDLEAWAGRAVRVRLGVTGAGNAVVEWRDARILGAADGLARSIPLLTREAVGKSGRLGRPNVIVILLDAARADAFSPFGGRWETPAAEQLAAAGTVFAQAYSASSWTGQSVAAAMTGLYPDTIGAGAWGSSLPRGILSLAELMSRNGYRTIGWSHHPFYGLQTTLQRGFDEFHRVRSLPYTVPDASDLLGAADRPTFAFVHLMPPHSPYEPPEPFRGLLSSGYQGQMDVDAKALNEYAQTTTVADAVAADLEYVRQRYQENVAYADSLVGELLADLEQHGVYEDSLIVLLSDHGEAFFEHGDFLHAKGLFREMLHVPLVIKWPGSTDGYQSRVKEPVSLVDLVPTLVDGLDLADDGSGYQGRSLLAAALDGAPHARAIYGVTRGVASDERAPRIWLSLLAAGWKIAWESRNDRSFLFDLQSDPLESDDRAAGEPLRRELYRRAALRQAEYNRQLSESLDLETANEPMPEEIRKQLEALGYLQ